MTTDTERAAAEVDFILTEALRLNIRIGTNGDDLLVIYPPKLSREAHHFFALNIPRHRDRIIAHIIAENPQCQTTTM